MLLWLLLFKLNCCAAPPARGAADDDEKADRQVKPMRCVFLLLLCVCVCCGVSSQRARVYHFGAEPSPAASATLRPILYVCQSAQALVCSATGAGQRHGHAIVHVFVIPLPVFGSKMITDRDQKVKDHLCAAPYPGGCARPKRAASQPARERAVKPTHIMHLQFGKPIAYCLSTRRRALPPLAHSLSLSLYCAPSIDCH